MGDLDVTSNSPGVATIIEHALCRRSFALDVYLAVYTIIWLRRH